MSDFITRSPSVPPVGRGSERVSAANPATQVRKQREEEGDFSFEDKVDIAPAEHMREAPEEIDLSLGMVRALLSGEMPPEVVQALSNFAPLGDLKYAEENCQRIEHKGGNSVAWPNTISLTQALETAAS